MTGWTFNVFPLTSRMGLQRIKALVGGLVATLAIIGEVSGTSEVTTIGNAARMQRLDDWARPKTYRAAVTP